jgi:hypothetical protein
MSNFEVMGPLVYPHPPKTHAQPGVVKCRNRFVIVCGYVRRVGQWLRKASGAETQRTAILVTVHIVNKMVKVAGINSKYLFWVMDDRALIQVYEHKTLA